MSDDQKKKGSKEGYVGAYDAAQRLHARLAENSKVDAREAARFALQGKALHQVKDFARIGFMLDPQATEEAFERLWRTAFHFNENELSK
jgi:hypothetical protein